ncbi:uncharacterized protein UV8b_02443 [Ustilaginoidea virens]|uniref:Uncharacterized protein n=1 Tax=Ustilaginoidea virens TaxID=1159556 RepID=A0A063BWY1_USTVR|nr:uncharacterized protein UV8b_02443 [Ustilaginoidea virens]QUC18202.1 hypothetical protein UV8b_02443 [Ustilaginoidea virens]GAO15935.1 hypothetical protein UVI_02039570 [Ustilaginoidea virens]
MVSSSDAAISKLQTQLEPYIKPREQVNYIRRVLALELGSYTGDGPAQYPPPLSIESLQKITGPELKGAYRHYIEALRDHMSSRQSYDEAVHVMNNDSLVSTPRSRSVPSTLLEDHLSLLKLRKKRDSLLAVRSHLQRLSQTLDADQRSLNVEQILKHGGAQPSVPTAVINSFIIQQSSTEPSLQTRLCQLEKNGLKAKLQLRQEQRALSEARAKCTTKSELVSNGAKLQALNSTRDELINWIEMELCKASAEEEPDSGKHHEDQSCLPATPEQAEIESQLQQIQGKYKSYTAARNDLLALMSPSVQLSIPHLEPEEGPTKLGQRNKPPCRDYLLAPYIQALLLQYQQQKALIANKAHFSSVLAKKNKASCRVLDRLAQESQLLSAHPVKSSARRRSVIPEATLTGPSDRPDLTVRTYPWIFAVDVAKIGGLETVAERIEAGQVNLEQSMTAVQEMAVLLGVEDEMTEEKTDATELTTTIEERLENRREKLGRTSSPTKKTALSQTRGDPWATLHGNLGLIGHDDVP